MEIEKYYKKITKDGGTEFVNYIFISDKQEQQFIDKNFQSIYSQISPDNKYSFIYILSFLELNNILKKHFKEIILGANGAALPIELILQHAPNNKFIRNNLDGILDSSNSITMCLAMDKLKEVDGIDRGKINKFIEEHKNEYVKSVLNRTVGNKMNDDSWRMNKDELYEYIPSFVIIIEELLKNEKKDWVDMEMMNEGSFLTAYQIGEKVLKIGLTGNEFELPNHRRFLQPLLRKRILLNQNVSVVIQEKIEPCELNAKELYKIYKELRDDGIYVTDFKPSNLGITKKPNRVHFEGIESVAPNAVGFDKEVKKEDVLPAGEAVLFDLDYCYSEKDVKKHYGSVDKLPWPSDIAVDFERRYRKEKGLKPLYKEWLIDSTAKYFLEDKDDFELD